MVITCIVTFLQDKATADVLSSIKGMLASSTAVIRDGQERRIDPAGLVPGDIVRLCLGDRVPADLRIIFCADLRTECSSLTGEPDAIPATVTAVHEAPIECRNIVFSSSLVMNGEGYGVVIKTGDNTMIGSIANLAAGSGHVAETLLEQEVHRFVNFIAVLAIIMAFCFFGIGMGRGRPWRDSFINGFIVVLVANVPEGLPATVTSCLSITAKRMAERNVLIKRTNIIESLGSATVIASDKTGTLTQNRMTVENLWYNRSVWNAYAGGRPDLLEAMNAGRGGGKMSALREDVGESVDTAISFYCRGRFAPRRYGRRRRATRAAREWPRPGSIGGCQRWGDGERGPPRTRACRRSTRRVSHPFDSHRSRSVPTRAKQVRCAEMGGAGAKELESCVPTC